MASKDTTPYSRCMLFLGSGASAFARYRPFSLFDTLFFDDAVRDNEGLPSVQPTTLQIMSEIKSSLKAEKHLQFVTHDAYMWMLNDYLQFCTAYSRFDSIRARLSSAGSLWEAISPFREQVQRAIEDITATTLHHYAQNRVALAKTSGHAAFKSLQLVSALYVTLSRLNNDDKPYLPIFTTNYDLLLEDIALDAELGFSQIKLINGIPGLSTEQAVWTADEYARASDGLHLHRLHGCVSWVYHGDERIFHHRCDLLQQRPQDLCVMIPGKEIFRGKNPHALGFRQLYHHFRNCDVALFVGFSFRDNDVKQLLLAANAVRGKKPIRLVIIDSELNRESVLARLEDAAKESHFPVKFPEPDAVQVMRMRFGEGDQFGDLIISAIKAIL